MLTIAIGCFLCGCSENQIHKPEIVKHPAADHLRAYAPRHVTGCGRCLRPWSGGPSTKKRGNGPWIKIKGWSGVEGHDTEYAKDRGCFPLCEECWAMLSPEERLPYYRQLWQEWQKYGPSDVKWETIEAAVLNEKADKDEPQRNERRKK